MEPQVIPLLISKRKIWGKSKSQIERKRKRRTSIGNRQKVGWKIGGKITRAVVMIGETLIGVMTREITITVNRIGVEDTVKLDSINRSMADRIMPGDSRIAGNIRVKMQIGMCMFAV